MTAILAVGSGALLGVMVKFNKGINRIHNLLLACVVCCLCFGESSSYGNQPIELKSPIACKISGDKGKLAPKIRNLLLIKILKQSSGLLVAKSFSPELNQVSKKRTQPNRARIIGCLLPQLQVTMLLAVFGQIMSGDSDRQAAYDSGGNMARIEVIKKHDYGWLGYVESGVAGAISYLIATWFLRRMTPNEKS